jgi:hypothetical protein
MKTSSLGGNTGPSPMNDYDMQSTESFLLEAAALHLGSPENTAKSKGTSGTDEPSPISVPTSMGLSPEGLMAYCQSRLNSLDTQMSTIFDQQQSNATLTQDVDGIATKLNDLGDVTPPSNGNTNPDLSVSTSYTSIVAAYQQAIQDAKTAGNAPLATQLKQDLSMFNSDCHNGTSTISTNDVTNLQQNLKNYGNELNSDSEMSMINLQSLMSQRETAVQLTTNLVQSLGQQSQDIAKNVGQ